MEITEITLHNEGGSQKPIIGIEWYSEKFVCYKYNKQLEIGLWDHCITLDGLGKIITPVDVGMAEVLNFNGEITEIVPPDQLNQFINKFMEGQTHNVKN